MKQSHLIFSNDVGPRIDEAVERLSPGGGLFVIADTNTSALVVDRLRKASEAVAHATQITIPPGDINKNVETLTSVWQQLSAQNATRHSLILNIGGGVVTDLGGMAAATFKRGVPFINIPTTLLAAVDAAVGGKTGVNLGNLKNEVGVFAPADTVIFSTCFFDTLSAGEIMSGYAEMVKHSLLEGERQFGALLAHNPLDDSPLRLLSLLETNIKVKNDIVAADPTETGLRRALNLGHTAGHAFETLLLERGKPVPHGQAVAWGILVSLILSHTLLDLPSAVIQRYVGWLKENYPASPFTCRDRGQLLGLMAHDKKNRRHGEIAFTLLREVGKPVTGVVVGNDDINVALDMFQDLFN